MGRHREGTGIGRRGIDHNKLSSWDYRRRQDYGTVSVNGSFASRAEYEAAIQGSPRAAARRRALAREQHQMNMGQEKWDVPRTGQRQVGPKKQMSERYKRYIESPEWRALRLVIIEQRGGKCERCTSTTNLHVHHKSYARLGREKPEDLEVLCDSCHDKEHDVLRANRGTWRTFKPEQVSLAPARQVPLEEYLARKSA